MANLCDIYLRATGEHGNLLQFMGEIRKMHRFPYCSDLIATWEKDDLLAVEGCCAWSMGSARAESLADFDLIEASKRLDLKIEYNTTESGMGFSEEFKVHSGEVIADHVYRYATWSPCDMDYQEFLEWAGENQYGFISKENFPAFQEDNDWISVNANPMEFSF